MTIGAVTRTRLEKAAMDNGFDLDRGQDGAWLVFDSSHAGTRLWLTEWPGSLLIAAFSHGGVVKALLDHGVIVTSPVPPGANGARSVTGFSALDRMLRRSLLLARTLPTALWEQFATATAALPRNTEAERMVVQRVGQDLFRGGLLEFWEGRCAISGLDVPELLRASHAKPWKDCLTDEERLDVHNGLLLAAHLDAAFDAGLITVKDDGRVVVAEELRAEARVVLGLDEPRRVHGFVEGHRGYLAWHREWVWRERRAL